MSSKSRIGRLLTPLLVFTIASLVHSNTESIYPYLGEPLGLQLDTQRTSLGIVVWLSAAWLASRLINGVLVGAWVRRRTGSPPPGILSNLLSALLLLVAVLCITRFVFDRPITGLLATSGIVTLVIGFAIRDMIADFFAGLALNLEQPYRIGDWIELEPGLVGRVVELNWRATRFVTQEQRTVIVPNSNLAQRQFINFSTPRRPYRESLEIVLDFTTEPDRAENVLLAAVLATPGLQEGGNHQVRIKDFTERGAVYQVRMWIDDYADRATTRHRVSANILRHLTQAGISIPHIQHEMFLARSKRIRQDRRIEAHRLLSRVGWLEALTEEELQKLGEVAVPMNFAAGATIVRQGEEGGSVFLLVEGTLEARADDGKGATHVVGLIEPGDALGEMSLLTGAPRAATVRARTKAFAFKIGREDFEPILRARPQIADELGRVMATRVLSIHRSAQAEDEHEGEDVMTRAKLIAKRISAFFGLAHNGA